MRILEEKLLSSDPDHINLNEKLLLQYQNESPDDFVNSCTKEFSNSSLLTLLRTEVLVRLKSGLTIADGDTSQTIWSAINPESKKKMKTTAINSLKDTNQEIREVGSSLCASIFVCEAALKNEWIELLDALASQIQLNEFGCSITSIETINIIWKLLKSTNNNWPPSEMTDSLIKRICTNLNAYSISTKSVAKALKSFIVNYEIRDKKLVGLSLRILTTLISESYKAGDERAVIIILKSFSELGKLFFSQFLEIGEIVLQEVIKCILMDNMSVSNQVCHVFDELIDQDAHSGSSFLKGQWSNIFKSSLKIIKSMAYKSIEDCKNRDPSIICFILGIMRVYQSFDKCVSALLNSFMLEYLSSTKENKKLSALTILLAFGQNKSGFDIVDFLKNILLRLIGLLKESSPEVKGIVSGILDTIMHTQIDLVLLHKNLFEIMSLFFEIIESDPTNDSERIIRERVRFHAKLLIARSTQNINARFQIKSLMTRQICFKFLKLETQRNKDSFDKEFKNLENLLEYILFPNYLNYIFLTFESLLRRVSQLNEKYFALKKHFLNSILRVLSNTIKRINVLGLEIESGDEETNSFLLDLFSFVESLFKTCEELFSNGFIFAALITCYNPEYFEPQIVQLITNYILPSLIKFKDNQLFQNVLEASNLFAQKSPKTYKALLQNTFVEKVSKFLYEDSLDTSSKIKIFETLQTNINIDSGIIEKYVDQITNFIYSIFKSKIFEVGDERKILEDGENQLKELVLIFYASLVNVISQSIPEYEKKICDSFVLIQPILKQSYHQDREPRERYLKLGVILIYNFSYSEQRRGLVDRELLRVLLDSYSSHPRTSMIQSLIEELKKWMLNTN